MTAALKIHVNPFSHLVVEGEEKRVVLPFVGLCVSDYLSNIPVEEERRESSDCSIFSTFPCCKKKKKTEFSHLSYESLCSLANECSLRNILHGPHSPAHLLCPEELQPGSETTRPLSHPAADRPAGTLRWKHCNDVIHNSFKSEKQLKELINFLEEEKAFGIDSI